MTPLAVLEILRQLEPILTSWHDGRTLGDVAVVFGNHGMRVAERPRDEHDEVKYTRANGRLAELKRVRG